MKDNEKIIKKVITAVIIGKGNIDNKDIGYLKEKIKYIINNDDPEGCLDVFNRGVFSRLYYEVVKNEK